MDIVNRKYNRQSIRLQDYDYSDVGAYFVTICVYRMKHIFGEILNGEMVLNEIGMIVDRWWKKLSYKYKEIEIDEYCIMPNHIHGIIVIEKFVGAIHELPLPRLRRNMLLPKIIGYFKMNTGKQINQIRNTIGMPFWQRNYYEHIIRDEDDLNSIREYIVNNPAKWEDDEYYV